MRMTRDTETSVPRVWVYVVCVGRYVEYVHISFDVYIPTVLVGAVLLKQFIVSRSAGRLDYSFGKDYRLMSDAL